MRVGWGVWAILLGLVSFAACLLDRDGQLDAIAVSSAAAGSTTGSGGASSSAGGNATIGSMGVGGTGAATSNGGGGVGGTGTGGLGGAGGGAVDPLDCSDVVGGSGLYTIDPDGAGNAMPFTTYCEQDVAGGNWTLIARSAAGAIGNIGWSVNQGVATGTGVYSLDPIAAGLTVDMMLVLSRDNGVQAFTVDLPVEFVSQHANSSWQTTSNVAYAEGACTPNGGAPAMMNHTGHTSETDTFYFQDNGSHDFGYGLRVDGFSLAGTDCDKTGSLGGKQGEIYVR
jgi:hypothetical protein